MRVTDRRRRAGIGSLVTPRRAIASSKGVKTACGSSAATRRPAAPATAGGHRVAPATINCTGATTALAATQTSRRAKTCSASRNDGTLGRTTSSGRGCGVPTRSHAPAPAKG